jgi:phosphoribosylglycinamide formyltransferase-1
MKIGFFASHRGSNMQTVVDACFTGKLTATPAVVVSNNRGAEALQRAQSYGVPTYVLNSIMYPDPDQLDARILESLQTHGCEIVLLAGFMKKIGPRVLSAFKGRILNIHPALLPKYGGKGMFGAKVHEAVLAAGDKITGVSVHLVDEEYDHGRVLIQAEVPVLADDSVETLAARVLQKEHEILITALRQIIEGQIKL